MVGAGGRGRIRNCAGTTTTARGTATKAEQEDHHGGPLRRTRARTRAVPRCGKCGPCQTLDCGECRNCLSNRRLVGNDDIDDESSKKKECCRRRRCAALWNRRAEEEDVKYDAVEKVTSINATAKYEEVEEEKEETKQLATQQSRSNTGSHSIKLPSIKLRVSSKTKRRRRSRSNSNNLESLQQGKQQHKNGKRQQLDRQRNAKKLEQQKDATIIPAPVISSKRKRRSAATIKAQQQKKDGNTMASSSVAATSTSKRQKRTKETAAKSKISPKDAAGGDDEATTTTTADQKNNNPTTSSTVYGISVPEAPTLGICAVCRDDEKHRGEDVLLCDGKNCGREFHLSCCVPELHSVPENSEWYCQDCSRSGTTKQLRQYFQQHDIIRAQFYGHNNNNGARKKDKNKYRTAGDFLQALWEKDRTLLGGGKTENIEQQQEEQPSSPQTTTLGGKDQPGTSKGRKRANTSKRKKESAKNGSDNKEGRSRSNCRRPISELHRAELIHFAALSAPEKRGGGTRQGNSPGRRRSPGKATDRETANDDQSVTTPSPSKETASSPAMSQETPPVMTTPDFLLSKPVRIYIPNTNSYHTGRIVDYRLSDLPNNHNEHEFLIRFAAGKDDRKTLYHHWIVLEEHSLAVGTSLVWGEVIRGRQWQATTKKWTTNVRKWMPSMLWLRTSRELVPVQNDLVSGSQIFFHDNHDHMKQIASEKNQLAMHGQPPTSSKVWALARSFGKEVYRLLKVKEEALSLFSSKAHGKHCTSVEQQLQYAAALVEWRAQREVREWHTLKQVEPMGPRVLSSRDEYCLEPFRPKNLRPPPRNPVPRAAALCPSIPSHGGLDRLQIIQLLQLRSINITRDIAANMTSQIVPKAALSRRLGKDGIATVKGTTKAKSIFETDGNGCNHVPP